MIDWSHVTFEDAPADDVGGEAVSIPYLPRKHFRPLHASAKRWKFVCAHRRAGKTVALANQLIRAGSMNGRKWPPPRYGYVGPSFEQAKDLVWAYLKQYTEPIAGMRHLEGDLCCILPNRATIKLYGGAAAYERMRGMYFDGIVLDEFPLLNASVFSTVVRPCLADYAGFAIVSGTSNGDDHFNQLRLKVESDPRWDTFIIPLSSTGEEALSKAEALELTQDMSPEEYAREMECFPAGTLVATSRGNVPIENIRPGDSVLTHRGRWRPVLGVMQRVHAGKMIAIDAFGSGAPVLSTPEHLYSVYRQEKSGCEWVPAGEISPDDCLFLPTPSSCAVPAIRPELAALIAWYIAEGSVFANNLEFSLNPGRRDEVDRVLGFIRACGHDAVERSPGKLVVSSTALADRMTSWCGSLAEGKRLPFDLIGGHEELFFRELMLGDGCLSQPVQGGHCWLYSTISRGLAFDVQLLAGMLGRRAGICARPAGVMVSPSNGKEYAAAPSYQVRIPHGVNVNHSRTREAFPANKGMAYRVKQVIAVDAPFSGLVFNLSVKEDESYVVEGRAVHNCSFDAPVEGSYYGEVLNALSLQGRVCSVPVDLSQPVITAWDLGIHDYTCIWFYQICGKEIHFIDYLMDNGKGLDFYAHELQTRAVKGGYRYKAHCLPHDVEARELGTGQSRRAVLMGLLDEPIVTAPIGSIDDGIAAARSLMGLSWFDAEKCQKGLAMLRGYRKNKMGQPVHGPGPHSHGADAYRTFACAFHLVGGLIASSLMHGKRLRRRIRGLV